MATAAVATTTKKKKKKKTHLPTDINNMQGGGGGGTAMAEGRSIKNRPPQTCLVWLNYFSIFKRKSGPKQG